MTGDDKLQPFQERTAAMQAELAAVQQARADESLPPLPRIKGHEISAQVFVNNERVGCLGPFMSLDVEVKQEALAEEYLGDVSRKFDSVFKGTHIEFTGKLEGRPLQLLLDGQAQRSAEKLLKHALSGGLMRHALLGFQVRVYITRALTGAWLVRCRAADAAGQVFFSKRWRYRTRPQAMARLRWYLPLMVPVAGAERRLEARPLFDPLANPPDCPMASVLPGARPA